MSASRFGKTISSSFMLTIIENEDQLPIPQNLPDFISKPHSFLKRCYINVQGGSGEMHEFPESSFFNVLGFPEAFQDEFFKCCFPSVDGEIPELPKQIRNIFLKASVTFSRPMPLPKIQQNPLNVNCILPKEYGVRLPGRVSGWVILTGGPFAVTKFFRLEDQIFWYIPRMFVTNDLDCPPEMCGVWECLYRFELEARFAWCLVGLKSQSHECGYCGAREVGEAAPHGVSTGLYFQCCSRCKEVHYCNKGCQKAAWKKHQHVCRPPSLVEEQLANVSI